MKHNVNPKLSRRQFLAAAALAGAAATETFHRLGAAESPAPVTSAVEAMPVIDTHIHLYDPQRPQGVPWPNPENKRLYQTSLPARYRPIARPLGIVGAIEIECSSWLEDNQWVLDVAARDDIVVGTIGHLVPGARGFGKNLERFRKNPLFRGIRCGLERQSGREVNHPEFIADLEALAEADLVMDTANPSVSLLADVVRISDRVPNLRIVVDHLPQMMPPTEPAAKASYGNSLKEIRGRPQIYVKVSEVLRRIGDRIPTDLDFYRPRLDAILEVFGNDRVLFGSDWPNSDQWLPVPVGFKLVQDYFLNQGRPAAEKFFWRNSLHCYKWIRRNARQPQL